MVRSRKEKRDKKTPDRESYQKGIPRDGSRGVCGVFARNRLRYHQFCAHGTPCVFLAEITLKVAFRLQIVAQFFLLFSTKREKDKNLSI